MLNDHVQIINCYTDASYAKEVGGSVIGYKIGEHPIFTDFLVDVKNTEAEMSAVKLCIDLASELYPDAEIHIHTDCQKAVNSADDYPSYVVIHKMRGHIKRNLRDDKQQIFSEVDRYVRKQLRLRLKIIRNENLEYCPN